MTFKTEKQTRVREVYYKKNILTRITITLKKINWRCERNMICPQLQIKLLPPVLENTLLRRQRIRQYALVT